jgi:hypothetical protein
MKCSLFPSLLLAILALPCWASDVTIGTASLPGGTVAVAYSAMIKANGGCTPYNWKLVSGSLPAGVTKQTSMWRLVQPTSLAARSLRLILRPLRPAVAVPRTYGNSSLATSPRASTRLDSLVLAIFGFGLANRAVLQTMNEPFQERPALFRDFVLPSRSKHFFLNLWVADSHVANSSFLAKKHSEMPFKNPPQS